MKAAILCAAVAAVLAASPAQAVIATVCQPGAEAGTPPSFTSVRISGRGADGSNIDTGSFGTAGGSPDGLCVTFNGFEFASDAFLTIQWLGSGTNYPDHTATCNLAQGTRCTFPASDLGSNAGPDCSRRFC
ncbi:MAG: hypothetical protein BJ554DRAFT_780 [Olpidium bornovanus]|uniref:Uncharacterized protein n=1 Tax=Olpidium bornovanus TaxID=278681 RepID=A0A8H7ZT14_9FUNG|nr:MAG: hypothetical protein BJ554DRAFT_780 [Olpidium bornovanus]